MEFLEGLIVVALVIWLVMILINKATSATSASSQHTQSKPTTKHAPVNKNFKSIADKYTTYEEVQDALRAAGLESSNLIIGIDYTKSNEYTGKQTFQGKCLHHLDSNQLNPYQQVINSLGKTLETFDDDKLIPAYGFGDIVTSDKRVFPFIPNRSCFRFTEVLEKYEEITRIAILSGPTSFAPLIYEAINIVKENKSYHILIIIADGQVTNEHETKKAIEEASRYALSIILVGVGDGPWDMMREFDDELPARQFDNFQFVNSTDFFGPKSEYAFPDVAFAVAALQEIPDQFREIRRLKLL